MRIWRREFGGFALTGFRRLCGDGRLCGFAAAGGSAAGAITVERVRAGDGCSADRGL